MQRDYYDRQEIVLKTCEARDCEENESLLPVAADIKY
jgi:hypothetical protein